jgi:long-chain acyl-CoA synthetase
MTDGRPETDPSTPDFCATILAQDAGKIVDDLGTVDMATLRIWVRAGHEALLTAGLQAHEPVLVPVAGNAADVAAILAIISAGGVAAPVHARAHAQTLATVRELTKARFCLHLDRPCETPVRPRVEILRDTAPPHRPLLRGAALITFTSGSTGLPKGVVLSGARMAAKLHAIQAQLQMPQGAVAAVPLQLIFSFGQWVTFLTLLRGGTVRMTDRFDAKSTAQALIEGTYDYIAAVPTMLRMMLDGSGATTPFTILTGGETVTAALRSQIFEAWPGAGIHSIYGLTESGTSDLFHFERAGQDAPDTLGLPGSGIEVRVDPQTSELMVRSPFAMLGYLDMPEQTNAVCADGWLRTGDLAEHMPDGAFRFAGRLKELINRAGNKVSPVEVEAAFARHPSVSAVLATGVCDPLKGEAIHILVVPRPGHSAAPEALMEWAGRILEPFKLPDQIHLGEALPLGQTGKADRGALRARIEKDAAR